MKPTSELLLISDLDDTLLGDERALADFASFVQSLAPLRLRLVYATGRFYESVCHDIENRPLPEPLAVIGGVGSEIRRFPDGSLIEEWVERMSDQWSARRVREILEDQTGLELQPEADQSDFKVSYYAPEADPEQLARWREKLASEGIRVNLIYSSGRDVDFLPEGVNKGSAAKFVAALYNYAPKRVLVAGNSANDSALFEHGFRGIVVGNAHAELKTYAARADTYLSSAEFAAGVREGLEFWLSRMDLEGSA